MGKSWGDLLTTVLGFQVNLLGLMLAMAFALVLWAIFSKRTVLHCTDLITSRDGKLDLHKIGQLFGILIAVWAPVYTTIDGKLDPTVYGLSLLYLASIEAFAKWMRIKSDSMVKA